MPKARNPGRFWAYDETGAGEPSVLRLEGPIAEESWWGDEVTPAAFRKELEAHPGDIVVYINSPGGDVIAASMIYTMLMEHKGNVTVRIEGLAASAASIIAMAGSRVEMSAPAYMMIHNASTIAWGNRHDLEKESQMLAEVDKGIREAYHIKTGLSDRKLTQLMDDETWMSSRTAVELGFADAILGADEDEDPDEDEPEEPDEAEETEDRHALPAVAWSPLRQWKNLERAVLFKAALDSVDAGSRRKPETRPERKAGEDSDDAAERAGRLRLKLLSV